MEEVAVNDTQTVEAEPRRAGQSSWMAYVIPMALFMGLTFVEGYAPKYYIWIYFAKVLLVSASLFVFRGVWKDIRPDSRVILPAVLIGLLVFAEWVWLDKLIPYPHLGKRTGFNPFTEITDPATRSVFIAVRLYGLALLVPVMEELFWRSFALRYATSPNWESVPIGTYSWGAFWIVAAVFGLAHPEWLVAVICACAYALLLRWTRSLFACVVAHGVTNLALGLYVLVTRDWVYW
jgi:uncharacterized protein